MTTTKTDDTISIDNPSDGLYFENFLISKFKNKYFVYYKWISNCFNRWVESSSAPELFVQRDVRAK